jgi:hypothetical protein
MYKLYFRVSSLSVLVRTATENVSVDSVRAASGDASVRLQLIQHSLVFVVCFGLELVVEDFGCFSQLNWKQFFHRN